MRSLLAAAALALVASAPAMAQVPEGRVVIPDQGQGTITFFDRTDFNGAAVTFRQSEANVRIPFLVRSIRVEGAWRICPGSNFSGRCVTADQSYRDSQRGLGLMLGIGSVESLASTQPQWGGQSTQQQTQQQAWAGESWQGRPGGQTLRGFATQFFAAPEAERERVEACPGGGGGPSCAQQTADRFCTFAGWTRALSYGVQTLGRDRYLVDLLCGGR